MKIIANTSPSQTTKVVDVVTAVEAVADKTESVFTAQKAEASVSTAPAVVETTAPKVSWIKHVGNILVKFGRIFVKESAKAEPALAQALEIFMPQFAPEIAMADGLFSKIAKQIIVTQGSAALISAAPVGAAKLQAVTSAIGSEIDQWIANLFPGSTTVSAAKKAGLVQAVFDVIDEQAAPSSQVATAPTATSPQ